LNVAEVDYVDSGALETRKRLTGAVFVDVAKAFDTVWVDGLVYKLMALIFPSYLVKTVLSYQLGRTFEASFLAAKRFAKPTNQPNV
jgi:hypothetical protein